MSRLIISDVQAVGQTCSVLRTLVHDQAAGRAWHAIATNSLPAGHYILSMHSDSVFAEIKRIAELRDSICNVELAHASTLLLWQGTTKYAQHLTVSPSGRLVVTRRGNNFIVSSVDMSSSTRPDQHDLWSTPLQEVEALRSGLGCEYTWAQDESVLSIKYTTSGAADPDLLGAMTRFGVIPW